MALVDDKMDGIQEMTRQIVNGEINFDDQEDECKSIAVLEKLEAAFESLAKISGSALVRLRSRSSMQQYLKGREPC